MRNAVKRVYPDSVGTSGGKKLISLCLVFGLVVLAVGSCLAGSKDVGTTGMQFLKIAPGARANGMGGVYAGVADDVDALYFNPAGLCQIKNLEATFMHLEYFQGIRYEYLAWGKSIPKVGSLGLGVTLLTVGKDIERRETATPDPIDKFGASDIAVSLAYGREVIKGLSTGLGLKYLSSKIDDKTASGIAADLGVLYKTPIKLDVGVSVQNLGAITKAFISEKDKLPVNVKLGLAYRLLQDNLTLGLDTNIPLDNDVNVALGAEYKLRFARDFAAAFRAGYRTGFDIGSGLGVGAGFAFKGYALDFAWVPYEELGNSYRISLLAKF